MCLIILLISSEMIIEIIRVMLVVVGFDRFRWISRLKVLCWILLWKISRIRVDWLM